MRDAKLIEQKRILMEQKKISLEEKKLQFEREKHARDRWRYEDGLIAKRLEWLFISQGILGAAFAYVRKEMSVNELASLGSWDVRVLMWGVPIIAILICGAIFNGIKAAKLAQHKLQEKYPEFDLGIGKELTFAGQAVPTIIAGLFLVAWAGIYILMLRVS